MGTWGLGVGLGDNPLGLGAVNLFVWKKLKERFNSPVKNSQNTFQKHLFFLPTSHHTVLATILVTNDTSCEQQQVSSCNITKYCACHDPGHR